MTPLYCSKGHENAPGNLFCQWCGEKLNPAVVKGIYPGLMLGDRYRIVRQLGHGGFGRTYLAEDSNRFQEPCVLKEFAPQVQGTYALQKAEELFEREAGVLYKLQHPQIPRFRELFRAKLDDQGYLFLVQDYVEGQTYRSLLETRKRQGLRFTEGEVRPLLLQILPVLSYIHSLGVIHRDISPDNLILRSVDGLPVLIDFGGVKQVAFTVAQLTQAPPGMAPSIPTRLGKIGYAPHEQMQLGEVYPHSDLYALAATVLVLLTGKEPQQLIDPHTMSWNWQPEVNLSPNLGVILDKMLSFRPGDRYQSARDVMQALEGSPSAPTMPSTQRSQLTLPPPPPPNTDPGTFVAIPQQRPSPTPVASTPRMGINPAGWLGKIVLACVLIGVAGGIGWVLGNTIVRSRNPIAKPTPTPTKDAEPTPDSNYSPQEQARKEALRSRRLGLGIDYNFYVALVNESFWEKYPNLRGRTLSDEPKDERLRVQWDGLAREWLEKLGFLSASARRQLGSYGQADRDRWRTQVNNLNLSSRALYDLADGEFFYRFPQQASKNFLNKPIGQVWHGIVADKVNAVQSGNALKRVVFPAGATGDRVSGTLKPGEGKVYIAGLAVGQLMQVNLEADSKVLFSVYPPTSDQKPLLEDSTKRTWSGALPSNGFYEFVVVSKAAKPINYQLNLTAENPAPIPTETPTPTESPTPTPTDTLIESPTPTPTDSPTESPTPTPTDSPTESPTPTLSPVTPTSPDLPL